MKVTSKHSHPVRVVSDTKAKTGGHPLLGRVIAPEPGTPFDPSHHQALMQQPSDEYKEPTVTQLLQKGYMLRDESH